MSTEKTRKHHDAVPVSGLYRDWFLEYASYVILERAVPSIIDGLKPVQKRILHAMKETDDGRFNKVANIIGNTMQYHPHGDASIGDALVNLGQKDLLIETQGNWGDVRTGDSAAAPRYIEARLSKLAHEILFNPQTTEWQLSYDGRKREPVALPVKFPLLLNQGVEGIAVGLATKIMPHNFCELIEASVHILKGKEFTIYPDFINGGMVEVANYNDGLKGGKLRVRAHIEVIDTKTLAIKDIPYGVTTGSLIDSIVKANDSGKIKIKKVTDNTAKDVEVLVHLPAGISPDITIDALYAFTDCEVSISPNACVIIEDKPHFIGVSEILKICTGQTVALLRRELEIRRNELMEKLLFSSLEKIFIENRIYRDIEEAETWEAVLSVIDAGLEPFKPEFYREIVQDDILRLTEIRIKRISKFDAFKADELMNRLKEELAETEHHLANLTEYAIDYYKNLLKKYGKGRERKTEIRSFDTINASVVAANNAKLYVNREEGFFGTGMKKDEFVCDCSDIDDILVFLQNGTCKVMHIAEKVFVGKDIAHIEVFNKTDDRKVFNYIYLDGKTGRAMVKRFRMGGVTRDRDYDLTTAEKGSKMLYMSANPNGEAEVITVTLSPGCKAKIKVFDYDFSELEIKGRSAKGNILTRYPVRRLKLKMEGTSTLGGMKLWYDPSVGRLNTDARGEELGTFRGDDKLLVVYQEGSYELTDFALTNRYTPDDIVLIVKYEEEILLSAVYYDGEGKVYYGKRFTPDTATLKKRFGFISEHRNSKLIAVTDKVDAQLEVETVTNLGTKEKLTFDFDMIAEIKSRKAKGNKLTFNKMDKSRFL